MTSVCSSGEMASIAWMLRRHESLRSWLDGEGPYALPHIAGCGKSAKAALAPNSRRLEQFATAPPASQTFRRRFLNCIEQVHLVLDCVAPHAPPTSSQPFLRLVRTSLPISTSYVPRQIVSAAGISI